VAFQTNYDEIGLLKNQL